ncbi:MAG: GDSL-type esterase/lipase family protein [Ginsengibacter sp.]
MRKINLKTIVFLSAFGMAINCCAQGNLGFEDGLTHWMIKGNAANIILDKENIYEGNACVRISDSGGINQRVNVSALSIVQMNAYVKSNEKVKVYPFIQFYDSANKLLLEDKNTSITTTQYQRIGNYTEAPPYTKYILIGIEKDSSNNYIYADNFSVKIESNNTVARLPICNLDEYMRPFWNSDTIYNETVLMYSVNGKAATGKLLFSPSKIISVKSFDLNTKYKRGLDYALNGRLILKTENSSMPSRADTSFDTKTNLAWYDLQSQWIVVTYIHHDQWSGPTPSYKGDKMPHTIAKLRKKLPLKIVALGMSITRGLNVSSYDTVRPYMPTYIDLFSYQLKKNFGYNDITVYNEGLPGAVVSWGADYAETYVNPLKPDLVILDFGMNDFWRYTPEQFVVYIKIIINKVQTSNPGVEFLLLSNMKFDPDYVLNSDTNKSWYQKNLIGYNSELQRLETTGIIDFDMTTLSDKIYKMKKAKDCIANPLHPNDYLARWYAQGMAALF